ncbi:MAG: S8 family peptidase, partial [Candidatus Limnocylindrales bacterium]
MATALAVPAGAVTTRPYLIGSRAPLTAAQVTQLKNAGAQVKHVYRNFGGASALIPDTKVASVRDLRFVTSVNRDRLKKLAKVEVNQAASSTPADAPLPGGKKPYWLDLIDAENNTTYDGSGVWVAVMDSGFYPNWRDYFDPSKILTTRARAFNSASTHANPNQWSVGSDPHGMAVAATIVGYTLRDSLKEGPWGTGYATGSPGTYEVPGVAPGAKIIPIKVCQPIGCFGSAINAGMDYITGLKLANPSQPIVINESLGGAGLDPVEKAAIDAATEAGVVIVASAGNSGEAGMGFPAAYEPVVSVGAGGWVDQWNQYPDKTWWLDNVPDLASDETEVDQQVYMAGFSSRQKAGQYLDVVSTGRYLLLPYPCVNLYDDGAIVNRTNHKTCASKATPDNAQSAPFQY